MVIMCQGRQLDLPQDLQLTKSGRAFRFSDTLSSEWSTSATLPKTANNMAILGVANMLDGSDGVYKDPIPIIADIGPAQTEGFIRVEQYTGDGIGVCFFFRTRADGDVCRKLYEILADDSDTITTNGFNSVALPALQTTPCGASCIGYGLAAYPSVPNPKPDIQLMGQLPAFTKVDGLLERLTNALGYTFQPTLSDLYLASVRRKVMPANGRQVIRYSGVGVDSNVPNGAVSPATIGGVCVCSDYDGGAAEKITYNRLTRVTRAAMYVRTTVATLLGDTAIEVCVNGTDVWSVYRPQPAADTISHYILTSFTIPKNGELEIIVHTQTSSNEVQIILELDQEWDEVFADDWEREAGWIVQRGQGDYSTPEYNTITPMLESRRNGQPVAFPSSYYYNYWGAMINLPDITLGEFLTSLGWYINKKPVWDGWQWTWQNPNDIFTGEVQIDAAEPYTDLLGRATLVGYREGGNYTLKKDNGFLEEEKWAHKSVFTRPALATGGKMLDLGLYDGTSWKGAEVAHLVHIDREGGFLVTKQQRLPRLLGMDDAKPVKVTGRAIGDISGFDFVQFAGHQAFIVESEWDEQTGCSTFTALLRSVTIIAKQLPFIPSIRPVVPGCSAQVITFSANDDDVSEVPTVDVDSTDPGYYIHGYAVQEGENIIYLDLPGGGDEIIVSDPLGNCEPWSERIEAGTEKYGVAVECEYIQQDGPDIVVGFSAIGRTNGEDFDAAVKDMGGTILQIEKYIPASAGPLPDYYICSSTGTGVDVRVKTPVDEYYILEISVDIGGDTYSNSVTIRNPYYIGV